MDELEREMISALEQYSAVSRLTDLKMALLHMHTALEQGFRKYLLNHGYSKDDPFNLTFPRLVDAVRDETTLFSGDSKVVPLLMSLNTTRNSIAHPKGKPLSERQVEIDAGRFNELIRRFWLQFFGSRCPVPERSSFVRTGIKSGSRFESGTISDRSPEPKHTKPISPPGQDQPQSVRPSERGASSGLRALSNIWQNEKEPRLRKWVLLRRVVGIGVFLSIGWILKSGAIFSASWPPPVKHISILLFLMAMASLLWGLVLIAKVVLQLRLKWLLIFSSVGLLFILFVRLLTFPSDLPANQAFGIVIDQFASGAIKNVSGIINDTQYAIDEFRFAYQGENKPEKPVSSEQNSSDYLTPIPANSTSKQATLNSGEIEQNESISGSGSAANRPTLHPLDFGEEQSVSNGSVNELEEKDVATPVHTGVPETLTPVPVNVSVCPDQNARLTTPRPNQAVVGVLDFYGSCAIENFDYYKIEVRRKDGPTPDEWHWIGSWQEQVIDGYLGSWDTSVLEAGIYTFRLTVIDRTANNPIPPCEIPVNVRAQ
ncbi:MAG: hypothetical protein JXA42_23020 [Anaerolineales bacterium]|nr:hypothetical protein [Anaerolineales bacterium]